MSDVMSSAEVHDQLVELLPARTVLSTLPALEGPVGAPGDPGKPGANGSGLVDYALNTSNLVVGMTEPSGKVS